MPFNEENHKERDICAAPYAITNCYHLVPSFSGRTGFSFLTGSVAMLERSVYNWLFGVRFTLNHLTIKPCLPKQYENAKISLQYLDKNISVQYNGYGNKILRASVNGKSVETKNGVLEIEKETIAQQTEIVLQLGV